MQENLLWLYQTRCLKSYTCPLLLFPFNSPASPVFFHLRFLQKEEHLKSVGRDFQSQPQCLKSILCALSLLIDIYIWPYACMEEYMYIQPYGNTAAYSLYCAYNLLLKEISSSHKWYALLASLFKISLRSWLYKAYLYSYASSLFKPSYVLSLFPPIGICGNFHKTQDSTDYRSELRWERGNCL